MLKIATICMNCRYDKGANLAKYLKFIDEAADNGADLILLPEQSLQGYLRNLSAMDCGTDQSKNEFIYQYENAETVPDGPSVQAVTAKAQERGVYVAFGMTEKDSKEYCKLYNTAVLVGPGGFIGKYRKVHQPGDEVHVYYPGNEFPVFDTPIGKIGMLICYDAWFPESSRALTLGGAEIILKPTATCFTTQPHDYGTDHAYYSYDLCERASALQNSVYFISANQTGVCGDCDYFGHSNIISPAGRILATTDNKEGIAYYEINDLKRDIFWGREQFAGLNYIKDRKPGAYSALAESKNV